MSRIRLAFAGASALTAMLALRARTRRSREVRRLVADLIRRSSPPPTPDEPVPLPPVVAVWLSRATERLPSLPRAIRLRQKGRMEISPGGGWRSFRADHWMAADPPAFLWHARFPAPGGLFDLFRVRDSYLDGRGSLRADLLGMVGVVDVGSLPGDRPPISLDEERLSQGELLRWLAETPWFPVAGLPGGAISWEEIDDRSARASVRDGSRQVEAAFRFGTDGFPEQVDVAARWQQADGEWRSLPWRGRFRDVALHRGLMLPREAEVSWIGVDGERPYWRGRICSAEPIW